MCETYIYLNAYNFLWILQKKENKVLPSFINAAVEFEDIERILLYFKVSNEVDYEFNRKFNLNKIEY